MKQVIARLLKPGEENEKFHILSPVLMILLFLAFWGVGFYVLLTTFS